MKHCRRVFILIFIMAAVFALMSPLASADMDTDTFGRWIGVGLKAANISVESTLPYTASIADFLVDPFNIQEGIYKGINYAFPRVNLETPSMTLENYLKRSNIQVRGDTITINGVDYQDIWVTNDYAQALRTNVLDLQTAFEIASNSSGKFVSGVGHLWNIPFFRVGDVVRSQNYSFAGPGLYSMGDASLDVSFSGLQGWYEPWLVSPSGSRYFPGSYTRFSSYVWLTVDSYYGGLDYHIPNNSQHIDNISIDSEPFDFVWVSQTIPAEKLDSEDGLHLYVPNNPDQFSDQSVKQTIRNFNINLGSNFDFDSLIDLNLDNNLTLFNSLFGDITPILDLSLNVYGPYGSSPTPTPTPTPYPTPIPVPVPTPAPSSPPYDQIGTSPWSVLEDWLRSIREYLQTIVHYLIRILDAINDLPNKFSSIFDPEEGSFSTWLKSILSGIRGILDNIADFLDNLASIIENGSAIFFKSLVDVLQDAFSPVLDTFKSLTSIWRYVVNWFGSISTPFTWALNAFGSAGGYMLSPFYAIAAAGIVLAIYRRLGR